MYANAVISENVQSRAFPRVQRIVARVAGGGDRDKVKEYVAPRRCGRSGSSFSSEGTLRANPGPGTTQWFL